MQRRSTITLGLRYDPKPLVFWVFCLFSAMAAMAVPARAWPNVEPFFGSYSGSANVEQLDGTSDNRDMSVTIEKSDKGFYVRWKTVITRQDGRKKSKSYVIEFLPSGRADVFAAAMKTNVFGHTVQMDPMRGEPYVWARISGQTLTVFSLYVEENGDYLMQQYDRTLADGGLQLDFSLHRNGVPSKKVSTFLTRTK